MIDLDQEIFLRETFTVLGHSKFIACLALSVASRYVLLPKYRARKKIQPLSHIFIPTNFNLYPCIV